AFFAARRKREAEQASLFDAPDVKEEASTARGAAPVEVFLGKEVGQQWLALKPLLAERITAIRAQQAKLTGFAFPHILFQDGGQWGPYDYEILFDGARHAFAQVHPDRMLAVRTAEGADPLPGLATRDPAFHLPAIWIDTATADHARESGYTLVDPVTVLM